MTDCLCRWTVDTPSVGCYRRTAFSDLFANLPAPEQSRILDGDSQPTDNYAKSEPTIQLCQA